MRAGEVGLRQVRMCDAMRRGGLEGGDVFLPNSC